MSTPIPTPRDPDLDARLSALHDLYVEKVNLAVAEDRWDLVRRLSDEYVDAALLVLTAA